LPPEPPDLFADAPPVKGKRSPRGLDALKKNLYAGEAVARRAVSRRTAVNGDASKGGPGLTIEIKHK